MKDDFKKDLDSLFSSAISIVSIDFGISISDIVSKSRKPEVVKARAMLSYMCRYKLNMSYVYLANKMNMVSHASVMHLANNVYSQQYGESHVFRLSVSRILSKVLELLKMEKTIDASDILITELHFKLNQLNEITNSIMDSIKLYKEKNIVNITSPVKELEVVT